MDFWTKKVQFPRNLLDIITRMDIAETQETIGDSNHENY